MNTRHDSESAFTLIELLVVIAIIAILAGLGGMALGGAGGRAPQSAAVMASSVFNLARTEAIMRGQDMLVIVDVTTTNSENFLRRMSVRDTSTSQTNRAPWTTLPSPVFFNQSLSSPLGTTNLTIGGKSGTYAFYRFKSNGQLDHSGGTARFVVSPGAVTGGTFQATVTNKNYGFVIHRMGKLTFIDDPGSI